jgi:hypothetical protein
MSGHVQPKGFETQPEAAVLVRPGKWAAPVRPAAHITRRAALSVALGCAALGRPARAAAAPAWQLRPLPLATPWLQVRAADAAWLGIDRDGRLWHLDAEATAAPRALAEGLAADSPLAAGHGRVAARRVDGRLWVGGADAGLSDVTLAEAAGLLVLPLAVIGVAGQGLSAQLLRLEPQAGGRWQVSARSTEPVLPDARPVQVDLDGRGDGGHLAVLAGPDRSRYPHAALGDDIEATRVLWLERHGLERLRALELPAPMVLEHNQLQPCRIDAAAPGLLSVRSGPEGGQLLLIEADPADRSALRVAAAGAPIGTRMRWMAPATDGQRIVAVHTPHIGGVLQCYRRDGSRLVPTRLLAGVSNHAFGSRELDVSAWIDGRLVLPDATRRRLAIVDIEQGVVEAELALPAPVRQLAGQASGRAVACLDEAGVLHLLLRGRA